MLLFVCGRFFTTNTSTSIKFAFHPKRAMRDPRATRGAKVNETGISVAEVSAMKLLSGGNSQSSSDVASSGQFASLRKSLTKVSSLSSNSSKLTGTAPELLFVDLHLSQLLQVDGVPQ